MTAGFGDDVDIIGELGKRCFSRAVQFKIWFNCGHEKMGSVVLKTVMIH